MSEEKNDEVSADNEAQLIIPGRLENARRTVANIGQRLIPQVGDAALAAGLISAATLLPDGWGILAQFVVGTAAAASAGVRVAVVEEELAAFRDQDDEVDLKVTALHAISVLQMEQDLTDDHLDDLQRRLDELNVQLRDLRHALGAYAEALAADDEESARAFARVSANAIAGRTRNQMDAAALSVLGRLTADGLETLQRLGKSGGDGNTFGTMGCSVQQAEPLIALGLIGVNQIGSVKLNVNTVYRVRPVGRRILDLTKGIV